MPGDIENSTGRKNNFNCLESAVACKIQVVTILAKDKVKELLDRAFEYKKIAIWGAGGKAQIFMKYISKEINIVKYLIVTNKKMENFCQIPLSLLKCLMRKFWKQI